MIKKLILVLIILSITVSSYAAWTVDSLTYDKRKKITIQTTNVGTDLTDFPLLVKIAADSDMADANADGFDIRFTEDDGSTEIPYERQAWTGGAASAVTAIFWVKSDVTTVGTGATDIYIYWRSTDTADGANPTAVWVDYAAVWHLNALTDSTGNGNTMTAYNTPTSGATGVVGDCYTFASASVEYLARADNSGITAYPVAFTCWFSSSTDQDQAVVNLGDANAVSTIGCWMRDSTPEQDVLAHQYSGGVGNYVGTTTDWAIDGTWQLGTAVFLNATSRVVYLDAGGYAINTVSDALPSGLDRTSIAGRYYGGSAKNLFNGSIDEVRIRDANVANHTADWVKFEYYNIDSVGNELTFGAEQPAVEGWSHKINGVAAANMAKVNSVAKANIAEINQT